MKLLSHASSDHRFRRSMQFLVCARDQPDFCQAQFESLRRVCGVIRRAQRFAGDLEQSGPTESGGCVFLDTRWAWTVWMSRSRKTTRNVNRQHVKRQHARRSVRVGVFV